MPARALLDDPVRLKAHMSVMVTASIILRRRRERQKLVQRLHEIKAFLDPYDGVDVALDTQNDHAQTTRPVKWCN